MIAQCATQDYFDRNGSRQTVNALNLGTEELRKAGFLVRLPPQPFKLLALLAGQPGQLVTREQIHRQIWGDGTFVDFEQGMNH